MKLTNAQALVLAMATILFTWSLGGNDLWAPDESYFAEGAREMIADGEWLVPHVNGAVTTDKPPLFFWLIALFSLPFGTVSSLTARLPSVLAAIGTLILTMRLARHEAGERTSVLAGVMLVTTHIFWDKARWAQIDSLLCFLITIALYAFASFRAGRSAGTGAGLVFWAACALAVLAKGPIGLLLPIGIVLVTLSTDRDLHRWRQFAPWGGPATFVAILGPWLVAVLLSSQGYSVWGALREHFVSRAAHGMHHLQPWWYYGKVLPYALLPWSFLLPGALLFAWKRRSEPTDRLLLVWSLFVVLVFTISREKRDLYILPAVPAMTLLSARLISSVISWWPSHFGLRGTLPSQKWITIPQGIAGTAFALLGIALPLVARRQDPALVGPAWILASILMLGGAGMLRKSFRGEPLAAVQSTAAAMATALLVIVTWIYPIVDPHKSGRALAKVVQERTAAVRADGRPVLAMGLANVSRSVSFYSNGIYLRELDDPRALGAEISHETDTYLVTNTAQLEKIPAHIRQRMTTLYTTRLSRRDIALVRIDPREPRRGLR